MATGPTLKRGPAKSPAHKGNQTIRHAGTAIHAVGGTHQRRLILAGVLGFLAVGGASWCGINKLRAGCAEDETAKTQAVDEKEKREILVDSFAFKIKVQGIGGRPTVKYLTSDLRIDQCSTEEGHTIALKVGTPEDAGNGFVKFRVSIEGEAHGKPVKYEVTDDIFADGAERNYELTAVRSAQ